MASQGLTRTAGSGSMGRAPSFSSLTKHCCRLGNSCRAASLRSTSVNNRHSPMESTAHRRHLDAREPAHEPGDQPAGDAVGEQEV